MEVVAQADDRFITSLAWDVDGGLLALCAMSAEVLSCDMENKSFRPLFSANASPTAMCVDSTNGDILLADASESCILRAARTGESIEYNLTVLLSKFEGKDFIGPSAVAVSPVTGEVLFTDGGAEGDSSLANPAGAVYRTTQNRTQLLPVCLHGLHQPSSIAIAPDGCVFVTEQVQNRLLRFVPRGAHYIGGVFARFQGTMGPVSVAVSPSDGTIYVALYEPRSLTRAHDTEQSRAEEGEGAEGEQRPPAGTVVVLGRDGSDRGIISTPGTQLRDVLVDPNGRYVYVVDADEEDCCSIVYRFDVGM